MSEKKFLLEYSEWLNAEITQRYAVSQHQQKRPKGRHALSDAVDVEAVDTGYNGYFKVVWDNEVDADGNVTKRRVKVINGADPTSAYAGDTDAGKPLSQTVSIGNNSLYLIVTYSEDQGAFSFDYVTKKPSENFVGWVKLADVQGDRILQVWQDNFVYFSERYYL